MNLSFEGIIDALKSNPTAEVPVVLALLDSRIGAWLFSQAIGFIPDGPFKTYAHEHPDELLQAVKEALAVIAAHPDAARAVAGQFGRS